MLISTKGRYALRVMIDLAEQQDNQFIPLKDIAARQEISEKYLESIIVILSKAGLVQGVRGKGGSSLFRTGRKCLRKSGNLQNASHVEKIKQIDQWLL